MAFVTIVQSPRDPDTNRKLVAAITDSFVDICGVSADRVSIHLVDTDAMHYAQAGELIADRAKTATDSHK
ncbi:MULTISPECIES: tautomerase family protein [unclassified Streptomyces]|uniref:tautomerase family protein n=1 Tax=unclassified Streptomyces TaxID=2593676 RepID=UPI0003601CFE|nr:MULTISPECIES: tautomerase family protein [unclassified Streptomyces]MYT33080.1 4-oxalocrotonate tautomerase [Streptomyces sp. SID8354]